MKPMVCPTLGAGISDKIGTCCPKPPHSITIHDSHRPVKPASVRVAQSCGVGMSSRRCAHKTRAQTTAIVKAEVISLRLFTIG